MLEYRQGLHAFLRAYYHHNSADRPGSKLFPLSGWTADELARYVGVASLCRADSLRTPQGRGTNPRPKHRKRDEPASKPRNITWQSGSPALHQ